MSAEIERGLLAACLTDGSKLGEVWKIVTVEDFSEPFCRKVYKAMLGAYREAGKVDPLIIRERLTRDGVPGAGDELAAMVESAPITANALTYAGEIRKAAALRRLAPKLDNLHKQAKGGAAVEEILREMHETTARLDKTLGGPDKGLGSAEAADLQQAEAELAEQKSGNRTTIPLPWVRLSNEAKMLRPGAVCLLGGPPGTGKSFWTSILAKSMQERTVSWKYLPLEDRRLDLIWRLFAICAADYRMIDDDPENATWREEQITRHAQTVISLIQHIEENPRVGKKDAAGKTVVPQLPYQAVVKWVTDQAEAGARLIFVDPISQIEFPGYRSFEEEATFMRKLLAVAADGHCTIFLVGHTVKRPGAKANVPIGLEDFQGSAMFGRLAHTVIFLDAHEPKVSRIYRTGGLIEEHEHNRTIILAKTRHGSGTRKRIAFTQELDGPRFEEVGVIAPKADSGEDSPF